MTSQINTCDGIKKPDSVDQLKPNRIGSYGDSGIRTHDLLNAIQALSQLSYTPMNESYYSTDIQERKDQKLRTFYSSSWVQSRDEE